MKLFLVTLLFSLQVLASALRTIDADVIKNSTHTVTNTLPANSGDILNTSSTSVVTNKTISADNNTITNIENADIKSGAAIDAAKIANGAVSSAEFQYLSTVTSDVQTQLDGKLSSGSGVTEVLASYSPTIAGSSTAGVGTYSVQLGYANAHNNMRCVGGEIIMTGHTGTGYIRIDLPYVSKSTADQALSIGFVDNLALSVANIPYIKIVKGTTYAEVWQYVPGGGVATQVPMDAAFSLTFSGCYITQ